MNHINQYQKDMSVIKSNINHIPQYQKGMSVIGRNMSHIHQHQKDMSVIGRSMNHIYQHQKGMSVIGFLLSLGVLVCFLTFGLRLFPLYYEYLSVKTSMMAVVNRTADDRKTTRDIRRIFLRNAEMSNLNRFTDSSVKKLVTVKRSKDGKKKFLNVKYKSENKLMRNIYLMMNVDETMELTGRVSQ